MNDLKCAAAKVCITPPADLLPGLYGLMRTKFAAIIDDLYVRLMMIDNGKDRAVLVGWDLDKAPNPGTVLPKLAEAAGTTEDHILYFAVHTHTAPLHSDREKDGPNRKSNQTPETIEATAKYEKLLEDAVLSAAKEAAENLRPARIGWESGISRVGENRVQDYFIEKEDGSVEKIGALGSSPEVDINRELFVLRAEEEDGTPIAFFINHPVHNCIMIMNNLDGNGGVGISADLSGQVSTLMEERYPGCVSLWSSGAAGNINPIMMNQINYADPVTGEPKVYMEYKTAETAQMMLMSLSRRQFADAVKTNRKLNCTVSEAEIAGGNYLVCTPSDGDAEYKVRLQAVRIGDLILCGASGELYDSLGRSIQACAGDEKVIIINHESSLLVESGYIIDDETFERCRRSDGRYDGVPGIQHTMQKPGYIRDALVRGAEILFNKIR